MEIRQLHDHERALWASFSQNHPQGSLWQSPAWEAFQRALGRQTRVYATLEGTEIKAAALVVIDRTTGGFSTWDIPRGPIGVVSDEWSVDSFLDRIVTDAKADKCLALYLSPPSPLTTSHYPLTTSPRHEQPDATRIVDLTLTDDALLAQMHPKGRYNIKVAQKHGVTVAQSTDIAAFHNLMAQTGERDAFGIWSLRHYRMFLERLPGAFLLLAFEGMSNAPDTTQSPIAGFLGVVTGNQGIYYYGASNYAHRASMAPYLLQWEAMQHCRSKGCTSYDLLGIEPPEPANQLTSKQRSHPWAGVSRFKAQFGGTVVSYPPEKQIVLRPVLQILLQLKRRVIG